MDFLELLEFHFVSENVRWIESLLLNLVAAN